MIIKSNNLKVLHLFNQYLPTTENWIYNLISNCPGTEIHIGAHHIIDNEFKSEDFHYIWNYYDSEMQKYRKLKNNSFSDILEKIKIRSIPFFKGTEVAHFSQYVQEHKIQLIHCHFADVAWDFLEISRETSIPLVVSFYGWDYEKLPFVSPSFKKKFKEIFRLASIVLVEGEHGAKILKEKGCPNEKIRIQKLGIDANKISYHRRKKRKNHLKIVQLASFVEKKGHILSLKAFHLALEKDSYMELCLVGMKERNDILIQLKNYISKHNLDDKVSIRPMMKYAEIHDFFKDYHVFIQPSSHAKDKDCEGGAPVALLDAQASGLPIIATHHCDIPSYTLHNQTGLLSEEKDIDKLAENILRFYSMDQSEYDEFSANARKHVEQSYDIYSNARELMGIYQEILR